MLTEDNVRAELQQRLSPTLAGLQPDPDMLTALRRRQHRRRRQSVVFGSVAGIVALAVTTALTLQLTRGAHVGTANSNPTPLINTGGCAGLSVVAETGGETTALSAGDNANNFMVAVGARMTLRASGPCSDILGFETLGSALQTPTGVTGGPFRDGVIAFTAVRPGEQTVWLVFGCAEGKQCLNDMTGGPATVHVTTVAHHG